MLIIIESHDDLVKKRKVGFRMINSLSQGQLTKKVSSQGLDLNAALYFKDLLTSGLMHFLFYVTLRS